MASQAAELKMPQAGGSQREPSMEEILASIRRIIEDSDQGRKPEEMLVTEAERRAADPEPTDMIAANASISDFDHVDQALVASEVPAASLQQLDDAPSVRSRSLDDIWSNASSDLGRSEHELQPAEPAERGSILTDVAEPVMMEKTSETASAEAETVSSFQKTPAPVEKGSLISERTGRQVAAAFGELSEAFEASRRKSFDELATEMMRPMLRDWLDNNLPTLVEKLVREEIERVARGGR